MKETKYLVELIQVGLNKKIVLHTNFIITPSFINNVRVNVKIYDVDTEGDSDAENRWYK